MKTNLIRLNFTMTVTVTDENYRNRVNKLIKNERRITQTARGYCWNITEKS